METASKDGMKVERKRGPVPGPERIRTTVYLEPDLVDWGKHKPGGLSEAVRRLMQEAKAKEGAQA